MRDTRHTIQYDFLCIDFAIDAMTWAERELVDFRLDRPDRVKWWWAGLGTSRVVLASISEAALSRVAGAFDAWFDRGADAAFSAANAAALA